MNGVDLEHTFEFDSPSMYKALKLLKLDQNLYFKVRKQTIHLKNVDFKQCLGVVELTYYCANPDLKLDLYFKVDSIQITKMLESFTGVVKAYLDTVNSCLIFKNKSQSFYQREYVCRCTINQKVRKICDLELVDPAEDQIFQYDMSSTDCVNSFKNVTAVENNIQFTIQRTDDDFKIVMDSRKHSNICKIVLANQLSNKRCTSGSTHRFEIFYSPGLYEHILKDKHRVVTYQGYADYLLLRSSGSADGTGLDFVIYLPVRQ